jgi:hypothetical protein
MQYLSFFQGGQVKACALVSLFLFGLVGILFCQKSSGLAAHPSYFKNVASTCGLPDTRSTRNIWVDVNGDGEPDIVSQNQFVYLNKVGKAGRRFELAKTGQLGKPCNDENAANLLLFADVDNDGDEDVLAVRFQEAEGKKALPGSSNALLLNDGKGHFEIQKKSGLAAFRDPIIAGTFLDANHDGRLDIFTGASYRVYGKSLEAAENRLLIQKSALKFVDQSNEFGLSLKAEPGLADSRRPSYGVAHGDWNNDGRTDIFICTYGRQWNRLWQNNAGKGFIDQGKESSFAGDADLSGAYPKWTKDMWKKRFGQERQDEKPFRSNGNTFDAAIADYDNDGDMDVFIAEIAHSWAGTASDRSCLLVNLGKAKGYKFERRLEAIPRAIVGQRWNQGDLHAGWFDYDNDGLQDLLIASSDYPDGQFLQLFRQQSDHSFKNVSFEAGLYWEGASQISFADYDADGDLDILCGNSFNRLPKNLRVGRKQRIALFENQVGQKNNWLQITLVGNAGNKGKDGEIGHGANRSAIGARVTIRTGDTQMIREVRSSLGHAGHSDSRVLHFGLGQAKNVDSIEIHWPNAELSKEVFNKKIKVNQFLIIHEKNNSIQIQKRRSS